MMAFCVSLLPTGEDVGNIWLVAEIGIFLLRGAVVMAGGIGVEVVATLVHSCHASLCIPPTDVDGEHGGLHQYFYLCRLWRRFLMLPFIC